MNTLEISLGNIAAAVIIVLLVVALRQLDTLRPKHPSPAVRPFVVENAILLLDQLDRAQLRLMLIVTLIFAGILAALRNLVAAAYGATIADFLPSLGLWFVPAFFLARPFAFKLAEIAVASAIGLSRSEVDYLNDIVDQEKVGPRVAWDSKLSSIAGFLLLACGFNAQATFLESKIVLRSMFSVASRHYAYRDVVSGKVMRPARAGRSSTQSALSIDLNFRNGDTWTSSSFLYGGVPSRDVKVVATEVMNRAMLRFPDQD